MRTILLILIALFLAPPVGATVNQETRIFDLEERTEDAESRELFNAGWGCVTIQIVVPAATGSPSVTPAFFEGSNLLPGLELTQPFVTSFGAVGQYFYTAGVPMTTPPQMWVTDALDKVPSGKFSVRFVHANADPITYAASLHFKVRGC